MGGVNVQGSLRLQYHDWGALEQGTEPPTPQHKWLPTAPGVCSRCVCVCVHCCVCTLDGLIAEHKFWVWVTILGHMSRHFHFHYFKKPHKNCQECPQQMSVPSNLWKMNLPSLWTQNKWKNSTNKLIFTFYLYLAFIQTRNIADSSY